MKATVQFVKERFGVFNDLMFDGKLPQVPIGLTRSKHMLGYCSCRKTRTIFAPVPAEQFGLKINSLVDLPQTQLEDIIIHEMIHLYIGVNHLDDLSAHGPRFRAMMDDLNRRFDRHIAVSIKLDSQGRDQLAQKDRTRVLVVATVEFHDGRTGFKVLPKVQPTVRKFYNGMKRAPEVRDVRLFFTDNTFFYDYPRSGRLAVHICDSTALQTAIAGAVRIVPGDLA